MSRIQRLIDVVPSFEARFVLYWMQASQRARDNHALVEAARIANEAKLPLVVLFVLDPKYPGANQRHFAFLLEGLEETALDIIALGASFVLREGSPNAVLSEFLNEAHTIVIDIGYTRIQRAWRKTLYRDLIERHPRVSLVAVESDVLVPIREAMDKAAYGAYVLRPKIHKLASLYRGVPKQSPVETPLARPIASSLDIRAWRQWFDSLPLDRSVAPSAQYHGGAKEAKRRLSLFLHERLPHYLDSADPSSDGTSQLSMYLHFGQIGVLSILDELDKVRTPENAAACDAFFEQLIVRRELAINFVFYNEAYDVFTAMTEPWAYETMRRHQADSRPYLYTFEQLERSQTHDPYWNACMTDMRLTGAMPNYMRMYWAKKVIEWSPNYETAFQTLLVLNDKYFLDGRDPNGYAGIAWCFGKHDRPWTQRPIFGTLRYMNDTGLKRKFKIDEYVRQVQARCVTKDIPSLILYNEEKG